MRHGARGRRTGGAGRGRGQVVVKTGVRTALGVLAREMEWLEAPAAPGLSTRLERLEAAFEGKTAAVFRACGLVSEEGRCRLCVVQ